MEWIKAHKDNYNLDAILFLARDGYVLQEISDQEGNLLVSTLIYLVDL